MKILYTEDEEFLREIVADTLREKCRAEVLVASGAKESIALLQRHPDIQLVISDYRMPNGNGGELYAYLESQHSNVPFILCSSTAPQDLPEFAGKKIAGFVSKPDILDPLIDLVEKILESHNEVDAKRLKPFFPVSIYTLTSIRPLPCVLYLRLSDTKFVKVMKAGENFESADIQRFHEEKKVDTLFIRAEDCGPLVCAAAKATMRLEDIASADFNSPEGIERIAHAIQDPGIKSDLATIAMMMKVSHNLPHAGAQSSEAHIALHAKVGEHIRRIGFTPEVQALVSASVTYILNHPPKQKDLHELLTWFKANPENYLSLHSIYLAHVSCAIATLMTWASDSTRHKLSLAAFLHDISLQRNGFEDLAEIDRQVTLGKAIPPDLTPERRQAFISHPAESAQFLKGMDENLVLNVEEILVQHHERPDGTGFPSRLNAQRISPLASVMIVAHDLVSFILASAKEPALSEFLESKRDVYTSGNFRKIAEALSKLRLETP